MAQHKGTAISGSGNHRGSIFRLLVGQAIIGKEDLEKVATRGHKNSLSLAAKQFGIPIETVKVLELTLERLVSQYIGSLPFLVLEVPDETGRNSLRGYVERNSIALLSTQNQQASLMSKNEWLGAFSNRERVVRSGLWNNNHVDEEYDSNFMMVMNTLVKNMKPIQ